MNWFRRALLASIVVALLLFGAVADHAMVEQAGIAEQAASSELEEKVQLTGLSVRATLARVEESVLSGTPLSGVITCRSPESARMGPVGRSQAYAKRDRGELGSLLAARGLTANGLPEAAVAAIALDDPDARRRAADRLLSGQLPVRAEDLPALAAALGAASDSRVGDLIACLRRAPDPNVPRSSPDFHRSLTERSTIAAASRNEVGLVLYEIGVSELLQLAGVVGAAVARNVADRQPADAGVISISDVVGLSLLIAPDTSAGLRIRMLRTALWLAVATTLVGLVAMLRAVGREARTVAREKAILASLTHELRTPLSAIRVFGETLAEGRGNPPEYGALVAQESQRLEALVEHVLTVARVGEAPSFVSVEPDEIIASALRLIASRAAMRSIRIDWDTNGRELAEAHWDGPAVRRALLNLLDNAVKYGKPGGRIEVSAVVEDDIVKLSVADDGPGIGRRDRKRVFGRFERGTNESPGTGLGLYVVEQVAKAHGGRVDLVSEENRGCTFTLVLPLRPRGAVNAAAQEPQNRGTSESRNFGSPEPRNLA